MDEMDYGDFFSYFPKFDDLKTENIKKKIQRVTEVTTNHLTPEIRLHLFTPNCPQFQEKPDEKGPFPNPFWGFYWAGGQVLTRYLLDHKEVVEGKNVLDVGSGCGASAIAAARFCGASSVTANEKDPIAACAIEMNAFVNDATENLVIVTDNLIQLDKSDYEEEGDYDEAYEERKDAEKYDCILLGDMFFNKECGSALLRWLMKCINNGIEVLVGDSGDNAVLFQDNAEKLADYTLPHEVMVGNEMTRPTASVWRLHA